MISIAANENNDLFIDATGNLAMVQDVEAVMQNCKTAMQAQMGEMIYRIDDGMPTRETAFDRYNAAQFEAAGRSVLLRVEGVRSIESFDVSRNGDVLAYRATIGTIYGNMVITNGL